jgi:uracil phosphoribosyltransferase
MRKVIVCDHPLVQHKLSLLRDRETSTQGFRRVAGEISVLMAYELTRDLPLENVAVETPLETVMAPRISGKKLCLVSILRAGNGLLEGMLDIVPGARVGHVGLYRDPETLRPVEYYLKLPEDVARRLVVVVDPMLATGNSAATAVARIKQAGATHIRFACLIAAPEGVATFHDQHPDVPVYAAAVDRGLDEDGYIRPGLGDAGDRLYGTR